MRRKTIDEMRADLENHLDGKAMLAAIAEKARTWATKEGWYERQITQAWESLQ